MDSKVYSKKDQIKYVSWYIKAICVALMILTFSISLDLIRVKGTKGVIEDFQLTELVSQSKQGTDRTSGYITEFTCKNVPLEIKSKRYFLFAYDTVYVKYTPTYKLIKRCSFYRSGKVFTKSPPEGTFIMLHILCFFIFTSCAIILYVNKHSKLTEVLITFSILFLILIYFFFGTGNYFDPY